MLANWVRDTSFNGSQSLCLEDCPNFRLLPSIGKLPLLKKVRIKGLKSVTSVGVEFFGENTPNAFPSLEILEFDDMLKWENWNVCEVDEEARKFPTLRELLIQNCPLLLGSVPEYLPSLEKLKIRGCDKLIISIQSFPMLSELEIKGCHKVVYKGFADDSSLKRVSFSSIPKFTCVAECPMLRSLKVESLEIDDCEELWSFRDNNWGSLTQSMSLGILRIAKCLQLVSIGTEEEREELMQLKIPYSIEQMKIEKCERLEKLSTTLDSLTSLRVLELSSCPKLISLSKNNLPLNLKQLKISFCEKFQRLLLDEGENVNTSNACVLQQLHISYCSSLERIYRGELPSTLKELRISSCSELESIAQEIQDNSSLEYINILWCDIIKYLPQGLNKLRHLQHISIWGCSELISFPESGLPTTNFKTLRLENCKLLQALPEGIHNLNYLEELHITDCPSVTSFPEEGIPTSLMSLTIGGPNICKPLIEWGLHRLTSLKSLWIENGCPDAVSFPLEEIGMMLPCSLTTLRIFKFPKLEILSSNGFHNLTSLKYLYIKDCPNLTSLPEKDMISSLLRLEILNCPVPKERLERDKGSELSNLTHIPFLYIKDPSGAIYG